MNSTRFLRHYLFIDAFEFVSYGYFNRVKEEDIPQHLDSLMKTEYFVERAQLGFTQIVMEQKKVHRSKVDPGHVMMKLIWRLHKFDIIVGVILSFFHAMMSTVLRPLFLREIILIVRNHDASDTAPTMGIIYAVLISLTVVLEGYLGAAFTNQISSKVGTQFMSWGMALVHRKSTTVSVPSLLCGEFVTSSLVGSDFVRLYEDWRRMCRMPSILFALIGGIIILFITLGVASLVGISIMMMIILINIRLAFVIKGVSKEDFKKGDERIEILSDLLRGIKAIKLTAWEYPFQNLLMKVRMEETYFIRKFRLLQVTSMNLGRVSPALAGCLSILTLVAINEELATPENLFVAMAAFLSLRLPVIGIPLFGSYLANTYVGLKRVGSFLLLPDQLKLQQPSSKESILCITEAKFSYGIPSSSAFQLNVGSLYISRGEVTAVVGRVGAGKTTLLTSVLGQTNVLKGSIQVSEGIAYVPQEPFILSGTIRENIILGNEFDQGWFNECIALADFAEDLYLISSTMKENLEVGERGQTLSGGQKQRLAICRALYAKPRFLILDDPLSAVDSVVGQRIFENLLSYSKRTGTSVLMSLNQFHFLSHFDQIFVLKNGNLVETGKYSDFSEKSESYLKEMLDAVDIEMDEEVSMTQVEKKLEVFQKVDNQSEESKLVKKDYSQTGAVGFTTLYKFISSMGLLTVPITLILGTLTYGLFAFNDKRIYTQIPIQETREEMLDLAYLYLVLSLAHVFCIQCLSYHHAFSTVRAGRHLHKECVEKLLHTPISWFESNPSGRIISRFSGDLAMIDRSLQFIFDDMFQFFFMITSLSTVVSIIIPFVIPVLVLGAVLFFAVSNVLDRSNREIKRFANQNLAPVLTNVNETEAARNLIQAMHEHTFFSKRQVSYIKRYTRSLYFSNFLSNWMLFISGLVSFILSISVAVMVILNAGSLEPSDAGLALTYCFLIPYFLQFVSYQLILGLSALTSLERILEYLKLPQEPNWHNDIDNKLESTGWPSHGVIKFNQVDLVYRKGLKPALQSITFESVKNEKIGVVGRTGAGKSSLTLLLFRVHECNRGSISIDGVDISTIGLQTLRKHLSSIPQHPLLLRGSVRDNLDPFHEFSDEEVNKVIGKIGFAKDLKEKPAMDVSIGQRQLISLGRILLRNLPKIVVMDEPTANIDQQTDIAIQNLLREQFKTCTILTIAHRLETIIDNNRILVLDAGKIVEFDSPTKLLSQPNGNFYDMVSSMGSDSVERLLRKAQKIDTVIV